VNGIDYQDPYNRLMLTALSVITGALLGLVIGAIL